MTETIKLRLWQVNATSKAFLFSTVDRERGEKNEGVRAWVPRSQIEHISRDPSEANRWQACTVTLPMWLAEAKDFA